MKIFWLKSARAVCAAALATTLAYASAPLTGTIFATTVDGANVNENVKYETKEEVYLGGGIGPQAPLAANGLPAGDYYFQVTDPSGKQLLSTDHISCRRVRVSSDGVIDKVYSGTNYEKQQGSFVAVTCKHNEGVDLDSDVGAITVQLFPYDDTPNNGGVYKAWMTRVGDYAGKWGDDYVPATGKDAIPVNGECYTVTNYHGFVPAKSKITTFRVKRRGNTFAPPEITVRKFHDANANGVWDASEAEILGWPLQVIDPLTVLSSSYTKAILVAEPSGIWSITETTPASTMQTVCMLDGAVVSTYPTAGSTALVDVDGKADETHEVVFGNVGLGTIKACKVYDRDGDGEVDEGEPVVEGWRMEVSGTDVTGSAYGPVVRTTGADGCATFANLMPGTYTVKELMPDGDSWVASGATSQDVTITSSLDASGSTVAPTVVTFTNYCLGTADFGTKGYWHNKNGLDEITATDIEYVNDLAPYSSASSYFEAGDEPFDGEFTDGTDVAAAKGVSGDELAPTGSDLAEISAFLIDSNSGGDAREQLAQQLLAFIFNTRHRLDDMRALIKLPDGSWASGTDLIADAIEAWESGTDTERTTIKSLLDTLNNSDALTFIHYYPCVPSYS